jgi:hypothetical protein
VRGSTQLNANPLQNTVDIVQNLVVPESQDTITLGCQSGTALLIVDLLLCMLSAIGLNDEPGMETDEIHDVGTNHLLAPKLESGQPACPEVSPQHALCVAGLVAHGSGACQ